MKNANFIAIDFETATPQRAACQIGIVVVKEGCVVEKVGKFIQPPNNKYSSRCIKVHGITPDMTIDSPTFDTVWNEIKEYFEGNFIVAHNAAFDIDVLRKSLDTYHIPHPVFMGTACTYQLLGMSLEDACFKYDISLCHHHEGVCDAEACALLFLKYLKGEIKIPKDENIEIEEYIEIENSEVNSLFRVSYSRRSTHDERRYSSSSKSFKQEDLCNDPFGEITDEVISTLTPSPFFQNKKFIITGWTSFDRERAYKIITSLGGKKSSSICKSLDYAIIGECPGAKKMEKLHELKDEGFDIGIFTYEDFISLIKSSLKTNCNE